MSKFLSLDTITKPYEKEPKRVIRHRFPDYEEIVICNAFNGGQAGGRKKDSTYKPENKIRNAKIVKKNLRRYALACKLYTHLVLTFADNITDVDYADNEFKKFMKRLRYATGIEFKYVATRELQVRGAIHYHVLIDKNIFGDLFENNPRYADKYGNAKGKIKSYQGINIVADIWGHGFCKIVEHGNNLKAINYIIKYVSKSIEDNLFVSENGQSKKAYLIAEGVKEMAETAKQQVIFTNFPNNEERNKHEHDKFQYMVNLLMENINPVWTWQDSIEDKIHITSILGERKVKLL